jgi:hypothetical protein
MRADCLIADKAFDADERVIKPLAAARETVVTRAGTWSLNRSLECPPPRSLAAEANDCFMVRTQRVQPNARLRRERNLRAKAGSPRVVCLSQPPYHRGPPGHLSISTLDSLFSIAPLRGYGRD